MIKEQDFLHKKLEFPWRRQELISWLKDLNNFDSVKEEWLKPQGISPIYGLYIFLEDHMLVFDHPYEQIGYSLHNKTEVNYIKQFAKTLDKVIDEQGSSLDCPVKNYINSPFWDDVISSSKQAYDLLIKNNEKYGFSLEEIENNSSEQSLQSEAVI